MVPGVADAGPEGDEHSARDAPPLGLHTIHRLQELLNPARGGEAATDRVRSQAVHTHTGARTAYLDMCA